MPLFIVSYIKLLWWFHGLGFFHMHLFRQLRLWWPKKWMMTEHLVQIAEKRRRLYTRPSVPKYNTVLLDGFKIPVFSPFLFWGLSCRILSQWILYERETGWREAGSNQNVMQYRKPCTVKKMKYLTMDTMSTLLYISSNIDMSFIINMVPLSQPWNVFQGSLTWHRYSYFPMRTKSRPKHIRP